MKLILDLKWVADGSFVTEPFSFWLGSVIEAANAVENIPLPYIARCLGVGEKRFADEQEARQWVESNTVK